MAFNPDKYLEKKEFTPDEYLEKQDKYTMPGMELKPDESPYSMQQTAIDTAKAVGQGITLGGGDELIGALKATFGKDADKISGWYDRYRKEQKKAEKEYEEAKERSPITTQVGEIGGALAAPVGTALRAAKGLGTLGKTALMGVIGGTTGGASSEATLEQPEELAKDIGIGAGLGGIAELGLGGMGSISKFAREKLGEAAEGFAPARQAKRAYTRGLEGKGLVSDASKKEVAKEAEDLATDITKRQEKGIKFSKDKYKEAIQADAEPIQLSDEAKSSLENIKEIFGQPGSYYEKIGKAKPIASNIEKALSGEATIQELETLKNVLRDNAPGPQTEVGSYAQSAVNKLEGEIQKRLGKTYPEVKKLYAQTRELPEQLISDIPEELRETRYSDILKPKEKQFTEAKKILEKSATSEGTSSTLASRLDKYAEKLKELQREQPELLKEMGIDNIDEYIGKIKNQADIQAGAKLIAGRSPVTGEKLGIGDLAQVSRIGVLGGSLAGQAKKGMSGLYGRITSRPEKVAQALESKPGLSHLGKAWREVMDQPSTAAKNAVLFSLMQNPQARKAVEDLAGLESEIPINVKE